MKSEPDVYSFEDLKRDRTTLWTGVRNYQARNFMMKEMKLGDPVLFYHSNASPPGLAGLAKVSGPARPDPTQWDKTSDYYDEKSSRENPRWFCVEVAFEKSFLRFLPLEEIKAQKALKDMQVLKNGQRLSIQPVSQSEYDFILRWAMNAL